MTEAEWLGHEEPSRLLSSLFARLRGDKPAAGDERFRRFAIACCRRVAEVLEFGDTYALDCLEIYATSKLRDALLKARRFHRTPGNEASHAMTQAYNADAATKLRVEARLLATSAVWTCTKSRVTQAAMAYREAAVAMAHLNASREAKPNARRNGGWLPPDRAELAVQAAFLRDIFGNPFRPPVAFAPEWRTDTAVSLAKQMYESREFSAMPILADALQDAGCDNEDILDHCRQPGIHVRGCWVVDLVLGNV